ncbi:hypothetical protein MVES1_002014 [Malassezia vespertilionis]|uniref:Avt3p n=1 Tax=Malassezia vespertilionis TaxID=2020962 RepID=A0A2N1JBY2_9BASI|nr:uncharacterized protein MVES1_002014 [Malassezia vespertilionis]PKI84043.1 Avt3p [Malassezia vespertilionis]WFD06660.1 hypothetical protein MVES1_002014 [Malassezia vespertilionis]
MPADPREDATIRAPVNESVSETPYTESSSTATPLNAAEVLSVTDEEKAKIVEKYLVLPDNASSVSGAADSNTLESGKNDMDPSVEGSSISIADDEESYQGPHHMQGGAVTEDLYRWAHHNRPRRPRSESMNLPISSSIDMSTDRDLMKQPGGFRRSYIRNQTVDQGKVPPRIMLTFVDFLMLYGHFAGEALQEEEEEEEEADEESAHLDRTIPGLAYGYEGAGNAETSRLLQDTQVPCKTIPRRMHGEASVTEAVLMLLKSFVGTGVLFLGRAFFNGGMLFSIVVLSGIAIVSLWSFLLLVKTNLKYPAGFGDMGGILYGPRMRNAILFSIVFSQLGFVAAYAVFVAENMQLLILSISNCERHLSTGFLIFLQCLLFLPLSLVRRLTKLSSAALVADAFILMGLVYVFYYEIETLAKHGLADVVLFNHNSFPLLIGTAVFTFEGIGLVIPITESMKEPQKFPRVLTGVIFGIMILFTAAGALSYAAFGSKVKTVVISNLPRDSALVQAVQLLYSLAILLSTPLQLFPALSIVERGFFKKSGKHDRRTKVGKNLLRCVVVVVCEFCAWLGASDLDKFVSFIGATACVPLCFIYPPLLHMKGVAASRREKVGDMILFIFGIFCIVFVGAQSISSMLEKSEPDKGVVCIPRT